MFHWLYWLYWFFFALSGHEHKYDDAGGEGFLRGRGASEEHIRRDT